MKRILLPLFVTLPLLALEPEAIGEQFEGKGVRASLLSEASTIVPGQAFAVALVLSHQPGFHTYWKNPGTVGMPTDIRWKLPEGFEAGQIVWQPPERSKMFKYDVYGYEANATLLTEIKVPANLPAKPILLQAKASWMACNDSSCNPGYHTFELRLHVGETTIWDPKVKQLVRDARSRIPVPLPNLRAEAESKGKKVRLRIEGNAIDDLRGEPELHFFSTLNHYEVDARQKIRIKQNTLTITLTKADYAPDKIEGVEGVLRFPAKWPGGKGRSHAFISATLD